MKITTLLETNTTTTSDPVGLQSQQTPKFGRDPDILEDEQLEETTAGCVASVAQPIGGVKTRGKGDIFSGIKTSKKFPNSASVKEDNDFAEYNDEAGMFKNNLQTVQRVSSHLEKAIADNENLPEWCQEKIAAAKGMIVGVMDYIISQHENGDVHTIDEAELKEEDKIITPGKGSKLKTGLHGKSEAPRLGNLKGPFKGNSFWVSDGRGHEICECVDSDVAPIIAKALNAYAKGEVDETKKLSTSDKLHRELKRGGFDADASLQRIKDIEAKYKKPEEPKKKEQSVAEVSDATLTSYLTKVDADSQKHEKDPSKRSAAKRNKSVAGFARAFNKLDARKEKPEELDEISLGDYTTKAKMDRAKSQMSAAFAQDPAEREKHAKKALRRSTGIDRATSRYQKQQQAFVVKQRQEQDQALMNKYANVDIDAELEKLQPALQSAYRDYQYGARNTWSQGKNAYDSISAKIKELQKAKELLGKI